MCQAASTGWELLCNNLIGTSWTAYLQGIAKMHLPSLFIYF